MDFSQEDFDDLLTWLDREDRESAGQRYQAIHQGLTRVFVAKGFARAEDMADDVITRVIKRLPEIKTNYVGDPVSYFHGVARNVMREGFRPKEIASDEIPVASIKITKQSDEYECLMRCLQFMTRKKRELVLDYHVYKGHDKVETHREMAEELRITEGALRSRVHRIRSELEECVLKCIESLRKQKHGVRP